MPEYALGCHNYFFSQYGYNTATQLEEACQTIADAGYPVAAKVFVLRANC